MQYNTVVVALKTVRRTSAPTLSYLLLSFFVFPRFYLSPSPTKVLSVGADMFVVLLRAYPL